DGDVIIVHPGENPTTMGGTYQEVAYSRLEATATFTDATNGIDFDATNDTISRNDGGSFVTDGFVSSERLLIQYAEDDSNNRYIGNIRIS
ncbi:MAG: hypothetical protein GWO26_03715, partial [Phycisphaerae bacterium]|nr:hypothetical protein [Phycisphaerae bacterium]